MAFLNRVTESVVLVIVALLVTPIKFAWSQAHLCKHIYGIKTGLKCASIALSKLIFMYTSFNIDRILMERQFVV